MKSDALDVEAADVYHMADASSTAELVAEAVLVKENTIIFEADAFSVYVVIDHEGNTTVTTPRVQFHFISQDYTGTANPYSASPFNFYNKADPAELQCSQILTKNESLEMIANPPNIIVYTHTTDTAIDAAKTYYTYASGTYSAVDNPDVGDIGTYYEATGEKFFYGWYVVNKVEDLTTYNGSAWTGTIQYNWPANPDKISFEKPMSLTDADGNALTSATVLTAGSTELKWTIDGVTYSGTLDNEGIIHVYLAPIYEDYYFINFRMGALDDSGNALQHSLMTRRLVVFGSSDSTSVRIGDIICPSSDPTHLVFIGWQTQAMHDANDQYYPTVDATGNEQNSSGSTSGYYITLSNTDFSGTVYDLYPLFAEARWLNFNTGKSGIGATYVGSTYRLTNDQTRGTYYENSFFNANTSTRYGYSMAGWYAFANMNDDSEITNLGSAQNVEVSYMDENSVVQTVTFNMKALELVHGTKNGDTYTYSLVAPTDGTIATATKDGHSYTLSASGGIVYLRIDGTPHKLFGVESNQLYFYRTMDDLTVSANWIKNSTAEIRVIIWKQKVTDDKATTKTPVDLLTWLNEDDSREASDYPYAVKGYDYEIFYTTNADTTVVPNLTSFTGTYVDSDGNTQSVSNLNLTNFVNNTPSYLTSFTGFHYSCNDASIVGNPNPDGTSVYNVYYDRNLITINYYDYEFEESTGTSNSVQYYGFVDGQYVPLTRSNNTTTVYRDSNGNVYSGTRYRYVTANDNSGTQYAFNGNQLVQIYYRRGGWYYDSSYSHSVPAGTIRYKEATTNTTTGTYGLIDGQMLPLTASNEYTWTYESYTPVTGNLNTNTTYYVNYAGRWWQYVYSSYYGAWYISDGTNLYVDDVSAYTKYTKSNATYSGTRYIATGWNLYKSYTGLYSQTLEQNGYTWPTEFHWYDNGDSTGGTSGSRMTFMDAFLPIEANADTVNFYGTVPGGTVEIKFYKEVIQADGTSTYVVANTVQAGGGTFSISDKYDGFTAYQYRVDDGDWTNVGTKNPSSGIYGEGVPYSTNLEIRFKRNQYNFTFDVNYPVDAALTYSNGESTNLVIDEIYYEAPLAEYATHYGVNTETSSIYANDLTGPDHYSFGGWYEDATGTVPFNFNSTMPAANKIVYAKWEKDWFVMHIDPNGAEIDHVDHAGGSFTRPAIPGERQEDSGYDPSQSTYFWLSYGSLISEYDVSRNYVPISDAAASQYTGTIYYYMNHQYAYDQDGEWGFDAKVRNALYLTESELHDYYLYYKSFTGSSALDEDTWQQYYTSYGKQKYRVTNNQEHYVFLGWYQVFDAGEATEHLGDMPYVFSTPISGDVYLRAMWRLDGGYKIQYHADYTMDDGTWINGDMEAWIDPKVGDITLSYADGAHTNVYKQPTNIRTPQGPTDEYIFRGFRLVSVREDSHENLIYKPMETDDQGNVSRYYDPGDVFTIRAANADTNSIIHLQAVYEEIDSSYRRPYITNLTLDANGGYLVNADGSTMMHNTDLTTSSGWDEIGTVAATVKDPTTGASLNPDAIIEFGDIQSNVALHLYRYATKLTHAGGNPSGTVLDPAGTNYFAHPRNYFLLGFDEGKTEGDYIATYGADAIISIDRNQAQTIYAVWEPMIYLNFKNETESTIHFGLSSTNALTMYILNEVTGLYDREKISDPSNISLTPNATIHLALPYGEEQSITVSGTNELGVGKILTWDTSVTDDSSGITYCTRTQGTGGIYTHEDVTYTHQRVVDWNTNQTGNCDHVLAHGQRDSSGDGAFSFDETLLINSKGLTVIFDEDNIAYALVLNDNYNGDGTGGGTQEYDYTNDYLNYTPHHSQLLPSTSSRMGYQLLGWAYRADATTPDFSTTSPAGNPWTIADLYEFFHNNSQVPSGWPYINDNVTMKATLYAVWGVNNEASTVYIYKNVPEPGNQNIPFDFTLNLSGTYIPSGSGSGQYLSASRAFQLYHGDYAILRSYNSTEQGLLRTEITVHKANGEDRVTNYKQTADTAIDTFKTYFTQDADTGMYSKVSSPDAANLSSYYEVVNAVVINAASAGSGGSWNPMLITVTETGVIYYDTTITCQAQNTTSKLFIGGHASGESAATVGTEVAGYIAHWDSTFAGGTLVFTNQRQTYDITVKKSLTSNTAVPGTFSFVASYEVDGETTTIYDQVTSGTAGTVLTSIPAGAVLTITEANDGSYITKYKIDDGTLVDASDVMETQGGETVRTGSATGSITVDAAKTITLDNTLKSYPVKFRLFDQYGNPLGGMFSLSSSIGSLGNALSASTTNGGVFYPTNYPTVQSATLYVDTYTLTQNIIPTGYVGLSVPATITVTGEGITTNSDMIYISSDPDVTDGFIITVYNIVPSVDITLTKILEDPLLNQRTFNFTVEYVYVLKDEDGHEMLTIHPTQTYNIAATSEGISEVIRVPGGAAVTITENLTSLLSATYDTTYKVKPGGGVFDTPVTGTTWTQTIGNDPLEIAFTNTRKTKIVTVTKTLEDSHATGAVDFHFDALLRYNGVGVGGYTLNSATSIVTDDGTGGTTAGHMTFTLSPTASVSASVELTVPYGTMLTVTEDTTRTISDKGKTVEELYNTSYTLNGGAAEDGNRYTFASRL